MHGGEFAWMFAEMRKKLNLQSLTLKSFLAELESTHNFYWDRPDDDIDARRDAPRKAISDFVTRHTNVLPYDLFDEQGPFGTGQLPGVVEVVGRADWDYYGDLTEEVIKSQWWVETYPDSRVDSFTHSEEFNNGLIALKASEHSPTDMQLCERYIKVASHGSITGEEELD